MSPKATETLKGTRTRWQCLPFYDDEALLVKLRLTYPKLSWPELTKLFNECVPPERYRTPDAISNKGPPLMKAHNKRQTALQRTSSNSIQGASDPSRVKYFGFQSVASD